MTSHPDFDDQGVVLWHTDFDTALAEAKKTGKGLFIESGRYACGNSGNGTNIFPSACRSR